MNIARFSKGRYVVAVSGGVDSVVLLDLLSKQPDAELVVAHFDHGMRKTSADDAAFVATLAKKYGVQFVTERVELGATASEETARKARYAFLQKVRLDNQAQAIVTAHHQDDLLETALINMLRGTGWRGLCSLRNTSEIRRPLLAVPKERLKAYAQEHTLQWRKDSTNRDVRFLRNRVRHELLPKTNATFRQELLALIARQVEIREEVEILDDELLPFVAAEPQDLFVSSDALPSSITPRVLSPGPPSLRSSSPVAPRRHTFLETGIHSIRSVHTVSRKVGWLRTVLHSVRRYRPLIETDFFINSRSSSGTTKAIDFHTSNKRVTPGGAAPKIVLYSKNFRGGPGGRTRGVIRKKGHEVNYNLFGYREQREVTLPKDTNQVVAIPLSRLTFNSLPNKVAKELLLAAVTSVTGHGLEQRTLARMLWFARTARPHKTFQASGKLELYIMQQTLVVRGLRF